MSAQFADVAELTGSGERTLVYEHGWQSWSPAGVHPVARRTPRPALPRWQTMAYRPETPGPAQGSQSEGLTVIQPDGEGPCTVVATADPHALVPSIRVQARDGRVVVSADGPVTVTAGEDSIVGSLAAWGTRTGRELGALTTPQAPGWCSWYCHGPGVTQEDIHTAVDQADRLALPIQVVQLDDGYQTDIGDWLDRQTASFPDPLSDLAARINASGRHAGLWTAPFCVGRDSELARSHPDWLVAGAWASDWHWGQPIGVLDVTHPLAAAHLVRVFTTLRDWGFAYHKVDFLYAGALPGGRHADCTPLEAYAEGLRLIRQAIGPDATLLACGAPLLPSIGRVDAMRVSPDIDPTWTPARGDVSQPSMQGALQAGRARAWQHGRLWTNDPDCILARREVARREEWAAYLDAVDGLAVSSDRLEHLDLRGLELTRHLLRAGADAPAPDWLPDPFDPDRGRVHGEPAAVD